jgi:hypothetical protein
MTDEITDSEKTKAAPPGKENAASEIELQPHDTKPVKWQTSLKNTLRGPRHRFHAERWGDHALHSTISSITREHGILFERAWCEVPTRFGKPCRVKLYWVAELSRDHAMRLVARRKREKNKGVS